jgi:hypothetical protein
MRVRRGPAWPAGREEVNAVALVRVYCGVATAELAPWLTVAVVDDSGRLLEVRHIGDDPAGYGSLVALLAGRATGPCPVAVDHPQHVAAQLIAAADRPIAISDEMSLRDFAERFADESSYEEMQAPPSQRRAVGLARALQAGALYATAQSPAWDLEELKPVLSAHAALVAGRQAAAVALREVLRELYPAALRAYLDPAELIPLRVLDAFPEPGLLASTQAVQAVIGDLAASGVTDVATATNAVTALRVAAEESRGRGNPYLAPAVAETVRQAVAAVRACDAASGILVASMAERMANPHTTSPGPLPMTAAPVSPAVPRPVAGTEPGWPATPAGIPTPRPESDPAYAGHVRAAAAAFAAAGYGHPRAAETAPSGYRAPNGHPDPSPGRGGGWEQQFGPAPQAAGTAPASPASHSYGPDTLSFSTDPLTAPLSATAPTPATGGAGREGADGPADDDLLIFSEANSVWFTNADDDTEITWMNLSSDDGWRAAGHVADPTVGPETTAGLPRRVPQANLVPGSVTASTSARSPRIVRDPRRIAAHTDGYFRGWRRGQEVGGFAVGQRDRAAWEFNREQRARQGAARLS